MIRAIDLAPDGKYVRVTRMLKPFSYDVPVASFGSIEEIWDDTGKVLAKISDRPINLGVQDDIAAAGSRRRGRRWRRPRRPADTASAKSRGAPTARASPTSSRSPRPPAQRRPAAGARRRGTGRRDDQPTPAGRRGGRGGAGAAAQGSRLPVGCAVRRRRARRSIYENPTRMTGHRFSPDMQVLFFSERAGQNAVESAVYLDGHGEEVHARALSRRRRLRESRIASSSTRGGGGGGGAPAARGGRGGGGGSGPVLLSADSSSVFFQGTVYDKNPSQVGAEELHRPGRDQDRREDSAIYESDNNDSLERVSTVLDADAQAVHRRARDARPRCRRTSCSTARRRDPADEERGLARRTSPRRASRALRRRAPGRLQVPGQGRRCRRTTRRARGCRRSSGSTRASSRPGGRTIARTARSTRTASPNFGARSMEYFVRLGYAVVEPDSPIVGPHGQMNNNYVQRSAQQPLGRRSTSSIAAALVDRHAARDRRPQLRRVLDRERDGAHAVLQGGHRRRRRLQPHADAARLPERAARPVGGAERLPGHVAVPLGQQPDRRAADVSQPRAIRTSAPIRPTRFGCSTR